LLPKKRNWGATDFPGTKMDAVGDKAKKQKPVSGGVCRLKGETKLRFLRKSGIWGVENCLLTKTSKTLPRARQKGGGGKGKRDSGGGRSLKMKLEKENTALQTNVKEHNTPKNKRCLGVESS